MFTLFNKDKGDTEKCSLSTFLKYKPFYITSPTEREKESCLCKKCLNMHLLLDGVNNFRKTIKLSPHNSATEFIENCEVFYPGFFESAKYEQAIEKFPEFMSQSETLFYQFEMKEECYFKNGVKKTYNRTARVDKKEKVSDVVKNILHQAVLYLRHRSHVDNVSKVLPLIKESFDGKYIELDFSENIAMKRKSEAQDSHFSGKPFSLHCAIVEPELPKYVYHLSDDTTHDSFFVHKVLIDIIERWSISNETVIIKSDNAPTQYKNKYAFRSMQNLADTYNITIIRLYGAAGHDKGLIDAMSSFGVKSILRRDRIAFNKWFDNSEEICSYLTQRYDDRMMYAVIDPESLDSSRQMRDMLVLDGCMKGHIFLYKPNSTNVLFREYLCDCRNCLFF